MKLRHWLLTGAVVLALALAASAAQPLPALAASLGSSKAAPPPAAEQLRRACQDAAGATTPEARTEAMRQMMAAPDHREQMQGLMNDGQMQGGTMGSMMGGGAPGDGNSACH
ncbi:MAG TPA: hypothetical protein VGL40_06335 [Bacillota bacterium]|jgi:hypothetical protein